MCCSALLSWDRNSDSSDSCSLAAAGEVLSVLCATPMVAAIVLTYTTFGVVGESGEFADKMKKRLRGLSQGIEPTQRQTDLLVEPGPGAVLRWDRLALLAAHESPPSGLGLGAPVARIGGSAAGLVEPGPLNHGRACDSGPPWMYTTTGALVVAPSVARRGR